MKTILKIFICVILSYGYTFAQSGRSSSYILFDSAGTNPTAYRYGKLLLFPKTGGDGTLGLYKQIGSGLATRVDSINATFRWQIGGETTTWQTDSLRDSAGYAEVTARIGHALMHKPDTTLLQTRATRFRWQVGGDGADTRTDSLRDSTSATIIANRVNNALVHNADSTSWLATDSDVLWSMETTTGTIRQKDTTKSVAIGRNKKSGNRGGLTVGVDMSLYNNTGNSPTINWYSSTADSTRYFWSGAINNLWYLKAQNPSALTLFTVSRSGGNVYIGPTGLAGDTATALLGVAQNVAIGRTYANDATAPNDGVIIEGPVGIGINTPRTASAYGTPTKLHVYPSASPMNLITLQGGGAAAGGAVGATLWANEEFYYDQVNTTNANLTAFDGSGSGLDTCTTFLDAVVVGKKTSGSGGGTMDGYVKQFKIALKNVAGTATLIGALDTSFVRQDNAGWNAQFNLNGSGYQFKVIGAAGENVTWFLRLRKLHGVGS